MRTTCLLALGFVGLGCFGSSNVSEGDAGSGSDAAPPPALDAGPSDRASTFVDAADGATIALDDGASLTIPPGALAGDAEVGFERTCLPVFAAMDYGGCRYRATGLPEVIGRISVALPQTSDDACVLAQREHGWHCLADSEADGGFVRGSFSTATTFTTRSAVPSGVPADSGCADLAFEPCGGDVTGEWELVRACATYRQLGFSYSTGPDPYAACAEGEVHRNHPYEADRGLNFTTEPSGDPDSEGELRYQSTSGGRSWERTIVTETCLTAVGESCACASDGYVCDCLREGGTSIGRGGSTYEVVDDELFMDGFDTVVPHCVSGDELILERTHHELGPYHLIFRRR
jgi:hypothetical protein